MSEDRESDRSDEAAIEDEHRVKLARARRAVASVPPSRSRGVLVIENDPDLQWRLARMLTVRGNRVVGTSSGEGAIALMRQWPVDLVLVDEDLPGMSWVEVTDAIEREHPGTPVVLIAGQHSETDPAPSSVGAGGVIAVVTKPFPVEALVDLLRSFPDGEPELAPAE